MDRETYARHVAARIEEEFLDKLRRFMSTSVPLHDIVRVQAEHEASSAGSAGLRLLPAEPKPPAPVHTEDASPLADRVRPAA